MAENKMEQVAALFGKMKIGDKVKVVDKESLLYNEMVELVEVNDTTYIFAPEKRELNLRLLVHKDSLERTVELKHGFIDKLRAWLARR